MQQIYINIAKNILFAFNYVRHMKIQSDYKDNISFNARLGANLKANLLKNDFGGSVRRLSKFEKLFQDTFEKQLDDNTVIELNKNNRLSISNMIAPKITYPLKLLSHEASLAKRILKECDLVYSNTEYNLFERIISKSVNSGKTMEEVSRFAETLNEYRRPYFTDLIGTAARILKENPDSKLTEYEFSVMINTQIREVVETPEFQNAMSQNFTDALRMLNIPKN